MLGRLILLALLLLGVPSCAWWEEHRSGPPKQVHSPLRGERKPGDDWASPG